MIRVSPQDSFQIRGETSPERRPAAKKFNSRTIQDRLAPPARPGRKRKPIRPIDRGLPGSLPIDRFDDASAAGNHTIGMNHLSNA